MKSHKSPVLVILAVISLLGLGGLLLIGIMKHPPSLSSLLPKKSSVSVLGESQESTSGPTPTSILNNFIQNTINTTKSAVSEQVAQAEKAAIQTVQEQISNLTKTEVENFKTELCRSLGVITPIPTKNP
jgi:hypothetical protein